MKNSFINNSFLGRSGSLVLMTLIMMTAFIIITHSMVRTTAYLLLLAQEREKTKY